MPPIKVARFEIRADARLAAEQVLHDFASRLRSDPDAHWHAWREPGTNRYLALGNAEGFAARSRRTSRASHLHAVRAGHVDGPRARHRRRVKSPRVSQHQDPVQLRAARDR